MDKAASKYVEAMFDNWAKAGGDKTALVNAAARFLSEIQAAATAR